MRLLSLVAQGGGGVCSVLSGFCSGLVRLGVVSTERSVGALGVSLSLCSWLVVFRVAFD